MLFIMTVYMTKFGGDDRNAFYYDYGHVFGDDAYHDSDYGHVFGDGEEVYGDLCIEFSDDHKQSRSYFPYTYNDTTGKGRLIFTSDTDTNKFAVSEIEIYRVENNSQQSQMANNTKSALKKNRSLKTKQSKNTNK